MENKKASFNPSRTINLVEFEEAAKPINLSFLHASPKLYVNFIHQNKDEEGRHHDRLFLLPDLDFKREA